MSIEKPNTRVLPGFMELLPEEQIEFDRIKTVIEAVFKQFGFTALDTPAIERVAVLDAKKATKKAVAAGVPGETPAPESVEEDAAAGETAKQAYRFEYSGVEQGLRFDLTVPLARYSAEHFNDLTFPFRRCHSAKVYRGEKAQKGRFREFYQCDIDVIGHNELSVAYDAEIPSVIYFLFKKLDFGKFTIRLNNRKALSGLLDHLDVKSKTKEVLRIIDKIEKISADEFNSSLRDLGLSEAQISTLLDFIHIKGSVNDILNQLKALGITNSLFMDGINELETVTSLMHDMGVEDSYYVIDLSVARGLDYYTGTVYETILDDRENLGSVCSGGRYDNLAESYTDEKLPGVGISIGLTRLFYQLREAGLIPCSRKTIADVIIVPFENNNIPTALRVSNKLRIEGFNVDVLLEDTPVKEKLQYVGKKDAPFAVLIGSEEEESGLMMLRFVQDKKLVKKTAAIDDLAACMRNSNVIR
ncbi:histidine--tRNA ligase [Spirochaetia bacterium]|nr:histidine--tRNA ligase [Spirochaetia bacterium]